MAKKLKKAKIIKGKKPLANDNFAQFNDELTLAELIQNAAARGLASVRGRLFAKTVDEDSEADEEQEGRYIEDVYGGSWASEENSVDVSVKRRKNPPKGADCACALGAQLLSPRLTSPLTYTTVTAGNDTEDGNDIMESYFIEADERSINIAAAYEQALRPEA